MMRKAAAMTDDARYLAAKRTVDDRALNSAVLTELRGLAPYSRILEVGAGLGTMVARLLEWEIIDAGEYTLLDLDDQMLRDARGWLEDWAAAHGVRFEPMLDGCQVGGLRVRTAHAEIGEYLAAGGPDTADLVVANAFLDLVDVPAVLPDLLGLLVPGGAYWFTINYDGETIFEPEHEHDGLVLGAYHRDMDERVRFGRPAGESQTGRHLFGHLYAAGAPPLMAGSSDWVVHPGPDGSYPYDEEYVVAHILRTIHDALVRRPDRVPVDDLTGWLTTRQHQLDQGELVYIAHQLDFVGRGTR